MRTVISVICVFTCAVRPLSLLVNLSQPAAYRKVTRDHQATTTTRIDRRRWPLLRAQTTQALHPVQLIPMHVRGQTSYLFGV